MEDFFRYLTTSEEDKEWGLFLNVAGKSKIDPNTLYPSTEHPTGYYFNWKNGRTLQEYQLNYITEGEGILENKKGKHQLKAGALLITKPGDWHRYQPLKRIGWTENYIGFNGYLADQLLNKSILPQSQIPINIGIREELIDTYYKIFDIVQEEKPGFQQIASGLIIKLLGYIIAFQKQKNFEGNKIEKLIQKVRFQMRENVEQEIDLSKIAEENGISYSYLRKMFKKYTGISPYQYHLELKIMRAKELILSTDKSIKEISFELEFQSIYYFSRLFKDKVGLNPTEFRKRTNK